jgi:hypothetical protein
LSGGRETLRNARKKKAREDEKLARRDFVVCCYFLLLDPGILDTV